MVLVARTDLSMSKGKIAAQCSHAAVSCYRKADKRQPEMLAAWLNTGQQKVVLKVSGLEQLHILRAKAESLGLVNCIICDAGHTQVPAGSETVFGVGPGPSAVIDEVTGTLSLL